MSSPQALAAAAVAQLKACHMKGALYEAVET